MRRCDAEQVATIETVSRLMFEGHPNLTDNGSQTVAVVEALFDVMFIDLVKVNFVVVVAIAVIFFVGFAQ